MIGIAKNCKSSTATSRKTQEAEGEPSTQSGGEISRLLPFTLSFLVAVRLNLIQLCTAVNNSQLASLTGLRLFPKQRNKASGATQNYHEESSLSP